MWTQQDYSFKKLLGKRVTSSIKKAYEEFGDVAIDIHATEVKFQLIAFDNPAQAVIDGVAEQRSLFTLTLDNSVAGNQAWYATQGPTRLTNWLSDKYGANYTVKLFDSANNEIFPTDASDWIFDYATGVLMFNGTPPASQPFKVSGYRYIGQYLSDAVLSGGGHQILSNGSPLPQRPKLNFLGFTLTDDSLNDQTIVEILSSAAPGVSYTPTTPSNWSYFTSIPSNVQEALDSIAAYIQLTAPMKAVPLTGLNLTFDGQTQYEAKIPAGLSSAWYSVVPAGSTVSTVVYAAAYTLSALEFRAGSANTPATYGNIIANVNGVDVNTYAMTGGPGSSGIIEASNFQVHNAIWEKADGTINANQTTEGAATYIMKHSEAGNSNPYTVYRDDSAIAVTFPVALTMSVNSAVNKHLSGVAYLGLGSVLNISFTIQNAFRKVYMSSGVAVLTGPGIVDTNYDPAVVPNFTDNFPVSATIALTVPDVSSITPVMNVVARKPNNLAAASSNFNITSIANGICTYGIVSTTTNEFFQDEDKRLYETGLTVFNSVAVLLSNEAQVVPGALKFAVAGGTTQYYNRRFTKATASNGNIQIGGITLVSQVSPYGTGNLNILLWLETEDKWFDLGRPFGSDNGDGSGSSQANSMGARVSFAGGVFGYSFGTYSTANNLDRFLFKAIVKSGATQITQLLTS